MYLHKVIFISLLSFLFIFVLVYGIYRAAPIIIGPKIVLIFPNSDEIEGTAIAVSGKVERAKTLYINGIPTAFTENGSFESKLAIYPGSNILVIEAYDRFGRSRTISKNLYTK